jgi:hypothetical protein
VPADVIGLAVRAGTTGLNVWSARVNSGTTARTSQGFTVVGYYDATTTGSVSFNGTYNRAIGTGGVRIFGAATAPSTLFVEELNSPAITPPSPWVSIGYETTWRAYQSPDLWQIRNTGDGMRETSQILITSTATTTITAGTTYTLGFLPAGMEQPAGRRGPYIHVQIRGSVITTGLLFITFGTNLIRLIPDATTQITTGSQYIAVDPMRWAI